MKGCGQVSCANEHCASSGKVPQLTSDEAAARAISCLNKRVPLCQPALLSGSDVHHKEDGSGEPSPLFKDSHQPTLKPVACEKTEDVSQSEPLEDLPNERMQFLFDLENVKYALIADVSAVCADECTTADDDLSNGPQCEMACDTPNSHDLGNYYF